MDFHYRKTDDWQDKLEAELVELRAQLVELRAQLALANTLAESRDLLNKELIRRLEALQTTASG